MRKLAVCAVALLAGCISTPQELRNDGERTVFRLKLAPDQAAGCVARNIENARHYQTTIRPMGDAREIIMRSGPHNLAVIEIAPAQSGSQATVWMRSFFAGREEFQRTMTEGC